VERLDYRESGQTKTGQLTNNRPARIEMRVLSSEGWQNIVDGPAPMGASCSRKRSKGTSSPKIECKRGGKREAYRSNVGDSSGDFPKGLSFLMDSTSEACSSAGTQRLLD
jgi:hypothetical protein